MLARKNDYEIDKVGLHENNQTLSVVLSCLTHIVVFAIIVINFKFPEDITIKENVYTVEVLPISSKSNIKTSNNQKKKITDDNKQQPKQPEKKEVKQSESKETEEIKKTEPEPKPKKDEVKVSKKTAELPQEKISKELEQELSEILKPSSKDQEKKKPVKKKQDDNKGKDKKLDEDFDVLLKSLEKKHNSSNENIDEKKSKGSYNENLPLSISEEDLIRSQIKKCWNPPYGVKDARHLAVLLYINLAQDGSLIEVKLLKEPSVDNKMAVKQAVDAAIRAVKRCSPLTLPADRYDSWKELEFNFDPKEMLD